MKAFPLAAILLLPLVGCASHDAESKSDRGQPKIAGMTLQEAIAAYVGPAPEPVTPYYFLGIPLNGEAAERYRRERQMYDMAVEAVIQELTRQYLTSRRGASLGQTKGLPNTPEYEVIDPSSRGLLGPSTPNAYGPGINADATGRPFIWKPDFGGPTLGPITPNAYGPGVGMDATGRPVRPACPPGWAGPC